MTGASGSAENRTGEPAGGRPGPEDHGRDGGMATREIAPELTEPAEDQDRD